jgi:putative RecB family exonuclease
MSAIAEPAPAAPAPVPLIEGQIVRKLQETVSASRLSLFHTCRLKFWFRYVQRVKKPKTPALHVGSAVHSVLKAWSKARWKQQPLTLKQLHEEYAKAWADDAEGPVSWENAAEEADEQKTGWRLVETYIRETPIRAEDKPDAVEVPVEADLSPHGLPTLIGILDLVQSGVVIDYKTASQTPNPEKAAHTNEVQTSAYAVLYRQATGKRENGIELHHLVKLKNPKLVVTRCEAMNDGQQTRLFRVIESYWEGLDRGDFVPSPSLMCVSCEYFNECRKWC